MHAAASLSLPPTTRTNKNYPIGITITGKNGQAGYYNQHRLYVDKDDDFDAVNYQNH